MYAGAIEAGEHMLPGLRLVIRRLPSGKWPRQGAFMSSVCVPRTDAMLPEGHRRLSVPDVVGRDAIILGAFAGQASIRRLDYSRGLSGP